ncbi:cyclic lactone autoinducer peptide [Lysinibacillus fusiformis]|nr:cyclic lactone autoinducer peptide [Lysinibacillus fusiformis]
MLVKLIFSILKSLATLEVSTASFFLVHEPTIPEKLRKSTSNK